ERVRFPGREVADRRARKVDDAPGAPAAAVYRELERLHEIAGHAEDVQPRKRARQPFRRGLQRGLRNVHRNVRRRTQAANEEPRLQALAAAVLDQLAALACEARDVVEVRARERKLYPRRVVLLEPADCLEQAAARGVVEILRRKGLLWKRKPGNHVLAET